jgi:hypothetical protein
MRANAGITPSKWIIASTGETCCSKTRPPPAPRREPSTSFWAAIRLIVLVCAQQVSERHYRARLPPSVITLNGTSGVECRRRARGE